MHLNFRSTGFNKVNSNGIISCTFLDEEIFIDRNGKYQRWDKSFESKEQLDNIIQQIVGKINRIVNVSNPIVDARLSDG